LIAFDLIIRKRHAPTTTFFETPSTAPSSSSRAAAAQAAEAADQTGLKTTIQRQQNLRKRLLVV
jgi:hypothetical protein